jgi:hypothetical protein
MSSMHGNRTRTGDGSASAARTIEEIEARAAEVLEADRDAMRRLAEFLRELAVELPAESSLPLNLAKAAKTIDLFQRGAHPELGLMDLPRIVDEWGVEAVAVLAQKLVEANIVRRV